MKLTKIHRFLKFKQSDRLKKYTSFFKLMVNSIYGKTMENLRKRINIKLVNNANDYVRYISKPSLFHRKYFVKNLVLSMK